MINNDVESASTATAAGLRLDFEPQFTSIVGGRQTATLEWKNITYSVGKKTIMNGLSGQAFPGDVVALMGPSGAGKSTLLNILAGRIRSDGRKSKLSGELLVNGVATKPADFRNKIAYVMQSDALTPTATTREALEMSAKLRLPKSVTKEERTALIEDIITSLGLSKVQNTMIGNQVIRGLSGGERKRVSIGVELVASPSVLFLDEPTSGLDSVSAWKIVRILNALANVAGRPTSTIICSIHQPSSEVFAEFSRVVLLGQGHVIYQGPTGGIPSVLAQKGFHLPPLSNPADFAMLCVQLNPLDALPNDDKNTRDPRAYVTGGGGDNVDKSSRIFSSIVSGRAWGLGSMKAETGPAGALMNRTGDRPGTLTQSFELSKREARVLIRDKQALLGRVVTTIVLNILIAVLFTNAANQTRSDYTTSSAFGSLIIVLLMGFISATQPAILTVPLDKVVALREMSTNTYNAPAYAFSKLIVELPVNFFFSILTFLIVYWAIGFQAEFMLLVTSMFLLMETGVSTAYLIGSFAASPEQAMELAPLAIMPQFFFLGLFISTSQLPTWLQWPQWLCAMKYGINIVMVAEFDPSQCEPQNCNAWAEIKQVNGVSDDAIWWYYLVLVLLFVVFRLIGVFVIYAKSKSQK